MTVTLHSMLRWERRDGDSGIMVDDPRGDRVGIHFAAFSNTTLITLLVRARLDVDPECLEQVLGHAREPFRAIDFQWHPATDRPGRKDQVWIATVIGMTITIRVCRQKNCWPT